MQNSNNFLLIYQIFLKFTLIQSLPSVKLPVSADNQTSDQALAKTPLTTWNHHFEALLTREAFSTTKICG